MFSNSFLARGRILLLAAVLLIAVPGLCPVLHAQDDGSGNSDAPASNSNSATAPDPAPPADPTPAPTPAPDPSVASTDGGNANAPTSPPATDPSVAATPATTPDSPVPPPTADPSVASAPATTSPAAPDPSVAATPPTTPDLSAGASPTTTPDPSLAAAPDGTSTPSTAPTTDASLAASPATTSDPSSPATTDTSLATTTPTTSTDFSVATSDTTTPGVPTAPPQPIKALTMDQARQVILKMGDHATEEGYSPDHLPDGCYYRAYLGEQAAQQYGVDPSVIERAHFQAPPGGPYLSVPDPTDPKNPVVWNYHTDPVIPVLNADGTTTPMVFDPAASADPIPLSKWPSTLMSDPSKGKLTVVPASINDPRSMAPGGSLTPDSGKDLADSSYTDDYSGPWGAQRGWTADDRKVWHGRPKPPALNP